MKLTELLKSRPETVIGRTPPDWDLEGDDGTPFFLKLEVRRDSCEEWLQRQDDNKSWLKEVAAKQLSMAIAAQNGARRLKGGEVKPLVGVPNPNDPLHDAMLQRANMSRADKRREHEEAIRDICTHLLERVTVCETSEAPSKAHVECKERIKALADQADSNSTVDPDLERQINEATNDLASTLSPDSWLAVDESHVISERPATDADMGMFFHPAMVTDRSRYLAPYSWTYCGDEDNEVTLATALCRVILDLAALASRTVEEQRNQELHEVKTTPSSGQNVKRRKGKAGGLKSVAS